MSKKVPTVGKDSRGRPVRNVIMVARPTKNGGRYVVEFDNFQAISGIKPTPGVREGENDPGVVSKVAFDQGYAMANPNVNGSRKNNPIMTRGQVEAILDAVWKNGEGPTFEIKSDPSKPMIAIMSCAFEKDADDRLVPAEGSVAAPLSSKGDKHLDLSKFFHGKNGIGSEEEFMHILGRNNAVARAAANTAEFLGAAKAAKSAPQPGRPTQDAAPSERPTQDAEPAGRPTQDAEPAAKKAAKPKAAKATMRRAAPKQQGPAMTRSDETNGFSIVKGADEPIPEKGDPMDKYVAVTHDGGKTVEFTQYAGKVALDDDGIIKSQAGFDYIGSVDAFVMNGNEDLVRDMIALSGDRGATVGDDAVVICSVTTYDDGFFDIYPPQSPKGYIDTSVPVADPAASPEENLAKMLGAKEKSDAVIAAKERMVAEGIEPSGAKPKVERAMAEAPDFDETPVDTYDESFG